MNCDFCELRCDLSVGALCGSYRQEQECIVETDPFCWTTCRTASSEDLPIFHAWPRRKLLEVGGARCNAACSYCINARIVDTGARKQVGNYISAKRLLQIAEKTGCTGIHFGISEVTTALPSALAVAKLFHERGFIVGASTNAYMTDSAAERMADNFDYLNISLKSLSNQYYRDIVGLPSVEVVISNIRRFASRLHVEVTTPIAQGLNDDEIMPIAKLLADINPDLPWHILRLQPEHKMLNAQPPDVGALSKQVQQARTILPYTYFSNFIGSQLDNTVCPDCGATLIRRLCIKTCGATLTEYALTEDKKCPSCGRAIAICGEPDASIRNRA